MSKNRYTLAFIKPLTTFLVLAMFSCGTASWAQQDSLSLQVGTISLKEALLKMETVTGYHFFYMDEWLNGIDVDFEGLDDDIPSTLDQLLANTPLNYYLLESEKRVILLQNAIIYDELPNGFFKSVDSTVAEIRTSPQMNNAPPPTFYSESMERKANRSPLVRIGKADPQNLRESYLLTGRVLNNTTGEPIPDLAIRVKGSNRVTVTNESGGYQIQLNAGYNVLTMSAMGIQNSEREVVMYNDGRLDLRLNEGLEQLDEVVVEADAAKNVESTDTGNVEIQSEESKTIPLVFGERDILQVAKSLPGISSAGEGAQGLNVRGGKTDQNLVLLDDAVIYNPSHFFGLFQALNPFTTEGVEIYKGSVPVQYGGRLSSVFDIRTIDGNDQKLSGEGSVGPVTANLALEVPIKKDTASLVIGGRAAYADWILRSLKSERLNNSKASFFDGIAKYRQKINENNEIKAMAYMSHDGFTITSDSLYSYNNRLFSLRWNHKFNERTTGAMVLTNSDYRFGIDFDGQSNNDFALDYKINESSATFQAHTIFNEKRSADYGVSAKWYSVDPGQLAPLNSESDLVKKTIQQEQSLEAVAFLGHKWNLSDRFSAEAGLRWAYFSAFGPATARIYEAGSPKNESTVVDSVQFDKGKVVKTYGIPEFRVSGRYLLDEDLSVKASFNKMYQFVHTLSNNTTASPIDTWKLSDYHIKPETAYQASVGIFKNINNNEYELSLEGYYKLMDNVLDFKTGADLLLNEHVETETLQGKGKAYGVELLLKKTRGDLNGWIAYTYSRSFYKFDGSNPEETINNGDFFPSNFDKPHDLSIIANYRFTRRYSISANFVYQTGRPITYPIGTYSFNNSDYVLFSDRNAFRIPDFYRLDLGVNIEGNHKKNKLAHSFWTVSVYNVLGRNNPYSVFFVSEGGQVRAWQSSIFAVPVPSITYNFKF